MTDKPRFYIDLSEGANSSLEAHADLALSAGFVREGILKDLRAPMGIYNVSASRVCSRLTRLCGFLEALFKSSDPFGPKQRLSDELEFALDYMEMSVYSAAEHVDDVYTIAAAYLPNDNLRKKHPAFRTFDKEVKQHKAFLSTLANSIKHDQSRLRFCNVECRLGVRPFTFIGYFVEGVKDGCLAPISRFHSQYEAFSVTALLWEIIGFLVAVSRSLSNFLVEIGAVHSGPYKCAFEMLARAVIGAARLPLYTLGEPHIFHKLTISLDWNLDRLVEQVDSGLSGSLRTSWPKEQLELGSVMFLGRGDGVSRSFHLIRPKGVTLHHWVTQPKATD